ncbi:MAG: hypothetical protein IJ527_08425 [Prevotella sp.]|nr:hypothetical protein [Prevotella sp.]
MGSLEGSGVGFSLEKRSDSLYAVVLTTDSSVSKWRLPYPVYRFTTGDVDGDGRTDALVGVVKATRFYPMGRRLFIFKNYKGHVRPLWMGSKLGATLVDFCFKDGTVRSLETANDGRYAVGEYEWGGFGLRFRKFLITPTTQEEAERVFRESQEEQLTN